jgi:cytochrome c3-like protein
MCEDSARRSLSLVIFCGWLCLAGPALLEMGAPVAAQGGDNCVACHRRQTAEKVLTIFQTSTHSRVSVGCDGCHGGDSSKAEKSSAHGGDFVARPDTGATLEMCGKCHKQPLAFFKKSRHVAAQPNAGRLDCVECHGVHAIGAASESFRWQSFCAGCHGLGYLPPLPRPFQEMLALSDDLREGIHRLEAKGRAPAGELGNRRKEIRHLISEIVHQTDSKGGLERIPRILEMGSTLKRQIASEENR